MTDGKKTDKSSRLISEPLNVVNIGLEQFSRDLSRQDIPVVQLDWKPPAGGNIKLVTLLSKLED